MNNQEMATTFWPHAIIEPWQPKSEKRLRSAVKAASCSSLGRSIATSATNKESPFSGFKFVENMTTSMPSNVSLWVRAEPFEFGIIPVPPPSKLVHHVSYI